MARGLGFFLDRLFRRRRLDRDMDEEIRSHIELRAADLQKSGLSPDEARRRARLEFGGVENYKEQCRETRSFHLLHDFAADLRYGLRMMRKSPGFTAVAVITLALGIGVNTAIFSVLNGWLLRPLPVRAPEQIMLLAPAPSSRTSFLDFLDLRNQAAAFSEVFAYGINMAGLSAEGHADEFTYSAVSGNYFAALGIKPVLGRLFVPGEGERAGEPLLVVLGYSYWQKRFAGAQDIVGKRVLVNGKPATVIGVAQKDFHGTLFAFDMDGYLPLSAMSAASGAFWTDRQHREFFALARLKSGVGRAQAQSAVDVIVGRLAAQYPAADKGLKVRVIPERLARPAAFVTSFVPFIAGLFLVLPALVLLLACVNVANILLARAAARQRELAVRAALGAGRGRLIRQLLSETFLLVFLASTAGVIIGNRAVATTGSLLHSITMTSSNFGYGLDCSLDWRVFAYGLAIALFTTIVVGVWPALHAGRRNVNAVLRGGAWTSSRLTTGSRVKKVLVMAQVAGSLTLLVVTGLFVRSLSRAGHIDLGFDPDHVLNVMLDPAQVGYDQGRTNLFYRDLKERLRALPGVDSASVAASVPFAGLDVWTNIYIEGQSLTAGKQPPGLGFNSIDTDYLQTMRIPLLAGRVFAASDDETARPVAIVNQTMAKKFWPHEDPIGKRFSAKSAAGPFIEIVGLARDGQNGTMLSFDRQAFFYVPLAQEYRSLRTLQIRSSVPPETLIPIVHEEIRKLAPDLPVIDCRTMQQAVSGLGGLFIFRVTASLAGLMGMLGLILAVVGVYGVTSYTTSRRTHEIGVRMALGAQRGDILKLVSRQGLGVVTAGILAGLVAAFGLSLAMRKLFFGVSPTDPFTYVAVAMLLAAVALVASYIPARRAAKVDPMVALRYE